MKICKRCFQKFDEDDNSHDSPVVELTDIFINRDSNENLNELCMQCREELGVLNLMGFKQ